MGRPQTGFIKLIALIAVVTVGVVGYKTYQHYHKTIYVQPADAQKLPKLPNG